MFFDGIIMLRTGKTKIPQEAFYAAKTHKYLGC